MALGTYTVLNATFSTRLRLRGRERGASSVELALYTPILFLIIFAIVQFGLSWHANQVASAVAREAARVARVEGGGQAARDQAEQHGEAYAEQIGGNALRDVNVTVVPAGSGQIRAIVTGEALEIVDALAPQVQQVVQGPIEEFRPDI